MWRKKEEKKKEEKGDKEESKLKNQYDIHIDKFSLEKVNSDPNSNEYEYNLYNEEEKIKTYINSKNKNNLLPLPETGPNWGRYGARDKGGDNWSNEKVYAALLGFFYSLPYNGF